MGSIAHQPKAIELPVIDYEALYNNDAKVVNKLREAGKTRGMFYLNLQGTKTAGIFEDVKTFFEIGNKFFHLPTEHEEKQLALRTGVERGYHANKSHEYYEIARDDFVQGKWTSPATIEPEKERVGRTLTTMNEIAQKIFKELLAGVEETMPELSDDPTIPSDTALKLLYKPPIHDVGQVILPRHTDFGILTLLWYDELTTQVPVYDAEGKETDEWLDVPVVPGAILVNVSDSLQDATGGKLHSTVHRVKCPEGPKRPKNGLAYFVRPYKS